MTRPISDANRVTRGLETAARIVHYVHPPFAAVFTVVIAGVVLYAATEDRLVAAIVAATAVICVGLALWWRRTKRPT